MSGQQLLRSSTTKTSKTFTTAETAMNSFTSISAAYANRRRPAKTNKIGFLDLPDEVRFRIYELAIYDHDRSVVFLPRAIPRKVTPHTDSNVEYVHEDPNDEPMHRLVLVDTIIEDGSLSTGYWTICGTIEEEYISDSCISEDESQSQSSKSDAGYARIELDTMLRSDDEEQISCGDCLAFCVEYDQEDCMSDCDCECHLYDVYCSEDSERESIGGGEDSIHVQPPTACLAGSCDDDTCEHCAGLGLGPSQNELAYVNEPEVDEEYRRADRDYEDDVEHFDAEEQIGMLYQRTEPPILLACTEIRRECLPIYYASNSFSWRFNWHDYVNSLAAFKNWCSVTLGQHVQSISMFSFEGRHTIEEGVEFVLNIKPGSTATVPQARVKYFHETDSVVQRIIYGLTREARLDLGLVGTAQFPRPVSVEVIQELGGLFVQAMQTVMADDESACPVDVAKAVEECNPKAPSKGSPRHQQPAISAEEAVDSLEDDDSGTEEFIEDLVESAFATPSRAVSEEL